RLSIVPVALPARSSPSSAASIFRLVFFVIMPSVYQTERPFSNLAYGPKSGCISLYRLGKQGARPIAQDFGELIVGVSSLNQLDDVMFGHGISLLWWRSGGVKHPHDMPPSRFPPSPTFSDSSERVYRP